jgi:acyl carrier protein
MTDAEVYQLLTDVLHAVFARRDIVVTPDLSARDVVGWDSIKQFDIIMEIEDRLGLEFHAERLARLRNLGDLARLVQDEMTEASVPR